MLSGVGPSAELNKHGIPVVHDLPGVGQHLTDHPTMSISFRTLPGLSLNRYMKPTIWDSYIIAKEALKYSLFGTGVLTLHTQEAIAFYRASEPKLFPSPEYSPDFEDSTSGPGAPDTELMYASLGWRVRTCFSMPKSGTIQTFLLCAGSYVQRIR
jgi:choline dehydrogenase